MASKVKCDILERLAIDHSVESSGIDELGKKWKTVKDLEILHHLLGLRHRYGVEARIDCMGPRNVGQELQECKGTIDCPGRKSVKLFYFDTTMPKFGYSFNKNVRRINRFSKVTYASIACSGP